MPPDHDAELAALGVEVTTDDAVRAECVRIARRLKHAGRRIVGLLPSSGRVAVPGVGVQLGLALAEVSGGTVAFVDANLRWPAASAAPPGGPVKVRSDEEAAFATRWLRGSLALITPQHQGQAGAGVPQLARVVREGNELFAHILVDLTGFKQLGEHLAAIEMMDGVLVVSRAGVTTEDELLRLNHELPPRLHLGVLLLG